MDNQLLREIVLIIILLALSGFFSSAETALVAVKKFRLRALVDEGNKRAKIALNVINDQSKMLSAILIGNNLVNTYLASLASMVAYRFGGYAVSLVTFLITFLILVFGEITPKTLATANPERLALWYAPIISFLMKILTPIIWFINLFSSMILRLFGVHTEREGFSITESELHTILDVSHEQGVIETEEHNMIRNVFDFKEAKASQIMVPRVHATMIDVNTTLEELQELYRRDHYTRVPVYEDSPDNIIGIINMKDLILQDPNEPFDLRQLLRKPYFTIENKEIHEILREMQKDQYNMTIVLDEYGEVAGILTVEDIIEEIVGEVQDEFDEEENENVQQVAPYQFKVKGYLSLHDLNDELNLHLASEDFDSIGGLIIETLGRFPTLGESVKLENGTIQATVVALQKNRIEEILLTLSEPAENEESENQKSEEQESTSESEEKNTATESETH